MVLYCLNQATPIPYAWLRLPTFGTVPTTVFFPTLPNVIVLRFSFHVPPFLI